jgi:hypothetical protein
MPVGVDEVSTTLRILDVDAVEAPPAPTNLASAVSAEVAPTEGRTAAYERCACRGRP